MLLLLKSPSSARARKNAHTRRPLLTYRSHRIATTPPTVSTTSYTSSSSSVIACVCFHTTKCMNIMTYTYILYIPYSMAKLRTLRVVFTTVNCYFFTSFIFIIFPPKCRCPPATSICIIISTFRK